MTPFHDTRTQLLARRVEVLSQQSDHLIMEFVRCCQVLRGTIDATREIRDSWPSPGEDEPPADSEELPPMPHRLNEQTAQLRETIPSLRASGLSVTEAVAAVVPVLRAAAEATAHLM